MMALTLLHIPAALSRKGRSVFLGEGKECFFRTKETVLCANPGMLGKAAQMIFMLA